MRALLPFFSNATGQNLIDVLNRDELQFLFRLLRHVSQILLVKVGNNSGRNSGTHRRQTFLFQSLIAAKPSSDVRSYFCDSFNKRNKSSFHNAATV